MPLLSHAVLTGQSSALRLCFKAVGHSHTYKAPTHSRAMQNALLWYLKRHCCKASSAHLIDQGCTEAHHSHATCATPE